MLICYNPNVLHQMSYHCIYFKIRIKWLSAFWMIFSNFKSIRQKCMAKQKRAETVLVLVVSGSAQAKFQAMF